MGKVTKKVLFGLIIIALALPMFVGCEPDTPAAPPATDYKAEFLNKLDSEIAKINTNANYEVTIIRDEEDFEVDFGTTAPADIKTAATALITAIRGLESVTAGTLTIDELGVNSYNIKESLADLETDVLNYFKDDNNYEALGSLTLNYDASVTYKTKVIDLEGEIAFTSIPDLDGV